MQVVELKLNILISNDGRLKTLGLFTLEKR